MTRSMGFQVAFYLTFCFLLAALGLWGFIYNIAHGHYGTGIAAGAGTAILGYVIYKVVTGYAEYRRNTHEGADADS